VEAQQHFCPRVGSHCLGFEKASRHGRAQENSGKKKITLKGYIKE
jgi:hypothetical protein